MIATVVRCAGGNLPVGRVVSNSSPKLASKAKARARSPFQSILPESSGPKAALECEVLDGVKRRNERQILMDEVCTMAQGAAVTTEGDLFAEESGLRTRVRFVKAGKYLDERRLA